MHTREPSHNSECCVIYIARAVKQFFVVLALTLNFIPVPTALLSKSAAKQDIAPPHVSEHSLNKEAASYRCQCFREPNSTTKQIVWQSHHSYVFLGNNSNTLFYNDKPHRLNRCRSVALCQSPARSRSRSTTLFASCSFGGD